MAVFVEVDHVDRVFNLPDGGEYIALKNIDLHIHKGEFVSLVGHSGCGKSTLLNILSGLDQPSSGGIILEGRQVTEPGPDRMVVFQNYSLLPWLTAYENIYLGVDSVFPDKPEKVKKRIVMEHLALVGLEEAAHKKPSALSGGMKQRVCIARALALRPKVLILDEPFGALDPITREELQEELLKIWQDHKITVLMITHDIDEALFLADRVVMMTNGPAAQIGEIMTVPFARPRDRSRIMEDPRFYELRNEALDFLYHRYAHDDTED